MKHEVITFNNWIVMPVMFLIAGLVLVLLLYVMIRFNKRANPTPKKFTHNTFVEVIWTIVPVLILAFIAIFSFRLLYAYASPDKPPELTIKATGYQWYWGYAYPDQKISEYVSNPLPEDKTSKELFRLATDNPLVVPVNRTVRVLITGSDVIHDWAVPAFGVKTDAIPGRVNQAWFRAEKIGTYYGQCSELCGINHSFMPIEVRVVSDADFAAWVQAHHGTWAPPGTAPASAPAPANPTPAAPAAPAPASGVAAPKAQ